MEKTKEELKNIETQLKFELKLAELYQEQGNSAMKDIHVLKADTLQKKRKQLKIKIERIEKNIKDSHSKAQQNVLGNQMVDRLRPGNSEYTTVPTNQPGASASIGGNNRRSARRSNRRSARRSNRRSARRSNRRSARRSNRRSARRSNRRSNSRLARRSNRRSNRRSASRSNRRSARRSNRRSARRSNRRSASRSNSRSASRSNRRSASRSNRRSASRSNRRSAIKTGNKVVKGAVNQSRPSASYYYKTLNKPVGFKISYRPRKSGKYIEHELVLRKNGSPYWKALEKLPKKRN